MSTSNRRQGALVGLVLLVLGVLFLLQNFTDWDIPWGRWWPVILIALGLGSLFKSGSSWVGGTVLVVLGALFLMDTLDVWDYTIGDVWRLWPVILVLVGAKILFSRRKKPAEKASHQRFDDHSSPGEVNVTSVFGSNHKRVTDQALAGGQVVSVFGATEIDLSGASLAGGAATLDVTAVFGGVSIRVPAHWNVDQQITSFLAGVDDKRDPVSPAAGSDRLTLTGTSVFGGIELQF